MKVLLFSSTACFSSCFLKSIASFKESMVKAVHSLWSLWTAMSIPEVDDSHGHTYDVSHSC